MIEIIYRIYEIVLCNQERIKECKDLGKEIPYWLNDRERLELSMDIMIIKSREEFKESIRSLYGKDIKFTNSKNLNIGDKFCVIIGEHAYSSTKERYFNKKEFVCAHCNCKTSTYVGSEFSISNYTMSKLPENHEQYKDKLFCSEACLSKFVEIEKSKTRIELDDSEWITKDSFALDPNIRAYIYKITKRSSGEFYVGQTNSLPIFRWGQHLKTQRFPMSEIKDYLFEIVDTVKSDENVLEIEKHWIQKLWKENPNLSLNISNTKKLTLQNEIDLEELA